MDGRAHWVSTNETTDITAIQVDEHIYRNKNRARYSSMYPSNKQIQPHYSILSFTIPVLAQQHNTIHTTSLASFPSPLHLPKCKWEPNQDLKSTSLLYTNSHPPLFAIQPRSADNFHSLPTSKIPTTKYHSPLHTIREEHKPRKR